LYVDAGSRPAAGKLNPGASSKEAVSILFIFFFQLEAARLRPASTSGDDRKLMISVFCAVSGP